MRRSRPLIEVQDQDAERVGVDELGPLRMVHGELEVDGLAGDQLGRTVKAIATRWPGRSPTPRARSRGGSSG